MTADDFKIMQAKSGELVLGLYDTRSGSSVCVRLSPRLPAELAEALARVTAMLAEADGAAAAD